jgi:hypothetical protein
MRRIGSLLVVAVLFVSGSVVTASASVDAKKSRFCRELENVELSEIGDPTSTKGARTALRHLRRIKRAAKGKTKEATQVIIDAYARIADGDSFRDVFSADVVKAVGTFTLSAAKCELSDIDLPDITLPDITLPDLR